MQQMINLIVKSLARFTNNLAAMWLVLIAVMIVSDILGRGLFNLPVKGIDEIIANSIVSILFLQIPLVIFDEKMIRATLVYDLLNLVGQKTIDLLVCLFGVVFFVSIAAGGWTDMIIGWQIRETEGSGVLEVPVYPARTIIIVMSIFSTLVYLLQFIDKYLLSAAENSQQDSQKETEV